MVRRVAVAAAVVIASVTALGTSPAGASTYAGTVELTCTTLKAAGTGASVLDRDNTGTGSESLRIDATDGDGTLLYTLPFTNGLGTYPGGLIDTTNYTTPPAHNPITFTLTSLAGNSLPEQVDVNVVGSCASIPWVAPTATAEAEAMAGDTVTVTGIGCPDGTVTAELHQAEGDGIPLASGTDTVTGTDDPYSIDLLVPADQAAGAMAVEVFCGPAGDPTSEVDVFAVTIVAVPVSVTTTTAPPAAAPVVEATPAFTG